MATDKKTFRTADNPAMNFITLTQAPTRLSESRKDDMDIQVGGGAENAIQGNPAASKAIQPQGAKKKEKRSKRFSLAVPPSLFEDLTDAAGRDRTNLNSLCIRILQAYVEENRVRIERFRELTGQLDEG